MKKHTIHQLDAYLERVIRRIRDLRQLNLAAESGLHEALEESQHVMASIAIYRHMLKNVDSQEHSSAFAL